MLELCLWLYCICSLCPNINEANGVSITIQNYVLTFIAFLGGGKRASHGIKALYRTKPVYVKQGRLPRSFSYTSHNVTYSILSYARASHAHKNIPVHLNDVMNSARIPLICWPEQMEQSFYTESIY